MSPCESKAHNTVWSKGVVSKLLTTSKLRLTRFMPSLETLENCLRHCQADQNTRVNIILTTNHEPSISCEQRKFNMAEPQPSEIREGDQAPSAIPGSNKSETAALNSLDSQSTDTKSANAASTAALGRAMKNLNLSNNEKQEVKNIKVELADVVLLVSTKI